MKSIIKRFVRLFIGLCIMSFGSAMALVADLGMEPWDVLNDGMAKFLQGIFDIQLANGADLTDRRPCLDYRGRKLDLRFHVCSV